MAATDFKDYYSILGITKQGTKKWSPLNTGDKLGLTYTMVGLTFLLVSTLDDGADNEDIHLQAGVTLTALGLAMVTIFNRKTYEIENPLNSTIKHKPWKIK